MKKKMIFLALAAVAIANAESERKIIINENYGTIMNYEQFKKYEKEGQIKTIDNISDTIKVTLKGPKLSIPDISEYKRSYSANLSVNGKKHVFKSIEVPSFTPKPTQYNLTDSCFYLTFSLSPRNQIKGGKMDVSIFLFCDSIPHKGQKFKFIAPNFNEDNPIIEWTKNIGNVAVMQVGYFPKATDVLSDLSSMSDKRIVLSTSNFTGEIEVLSIRQGKYNDQFEIELRLEAKAKLCSEHFPDFSMPLDIEGKISLYQIESADIVPCFFEIEHEWPEYLIPLDIFD